jgi:hypothetical protein
LRAASVDLGDGFRVATCAHLPQHLLQLLHHAFDLLGFDHPKIKAGVQMYTPFGELKLQQQRISVESVRIGHLGALVLPEQFIFLAVLVRFALLGLYHQESLEPACQFGICAGAADVLKPHLLGCHHVNRSLLHFLEQ